MISYLTCHDDWTLWDKLVYTMDPEKNYTGCAPEVLRANRLAAAIYFCCQGSIFFLAGEEFARTKGGIKNSYCSSSEVNQLDWTRAYKNRELVAYYRGLIGLRMQLPGLQDKSGEAAQRIRWVREVAPDCAMACVDNRGPNSRWNEVLMIFNCSDDACKAALPEGSWQILADGQCSSCWSEKLTASETVQVPAYSTLILGK